MTGLCDGKTRLSGWQNAKVALFLLGVSINCPTAQSAEIPERPVRTGAPPSQRSTRNLNPLSTLDLSSLGAFKGRPLFAPSRRPPPLSPVVASLPPSSPVESPPPDLRLVGVIAGADRAVAILRRPAGGSAVSLKVGDSVDAWRVDAIGPDHLSLRAGEREKTYRLFAIGGPTGPPSASRITNVPQLGTLGGQ